MSMSVGFNLETKLSSCNLHSYRILSWVRFVCFWGEVMAWQFCFEIYWPLICCRTFQPWTLHPRDLRLRSSWLKILGLRSPGLKIPALGWPATLFIADGPLMDVISRTCAQLKTIDLSGSTCLTEEDLLKLSNLRTTLRQIIDLWHFLWIFAVPF